MSFKREIITVQKQDKKQVDANAADVCLKERHRSSPVGLRDSESSLSL